MQRIFTIVAALGLFALVGAACTGETQVSVATSQQVGISVSGTGGVTVEPDIGTISLGVEVRAESVAAARDRASKAMDAVLDAMRQEGVEDKDIQTQFFNIYPDYSFRSEEQPEITGFIVNNQVQVKVRDLDRFSAVLDGAIVAGGDDVRVNAVGFTVDEPELHLAEARTAALADARARAEQLADESGVSLGRVISINESTGGGSPQFERFAEDSAFGGASPVSPGEQEIRLTVFVVYDIE